MSEVSEIELQNMTDFFSKHLLGIRFTGEVIFMEDKFEDDYTGELRKNPFIGSFEHHENSFNIDLDDEYSDICGYDTLEVEDYIFDYKNNLEDCTICISESLKNNRLRLIDTLLHELIHFTLWYQGLDHKDGDYQFEKTLKEHGISSNYDRVFDYSTRKWKNPINIEKIEEYEKMYQNFIKNKKQ